MAQNNTAEKVLELARSQVGTVGGGKYIDYYDQITGAGLGRDSAWCAAFVTWCMRQAGVPLDSVPNYCSCSTASAWFLRQGRFRGRSSGYVPKPGDIIMYEWDPQNEGTNLDDGDDHTGIVEYVEDGIVHTIEGNNNGQVRRDWWTMTRAQVSGYCVPLYNLEQKKEEESPDKSDYEQWKEHMERYLRERAGKPVADWAKEAVDFVKETGLMAGDKNGAFRPLSYITRQEAAQVLYNMGKAGNGDEN